MSDQPPASTESVTDEQVGPDRVVDPEPLRGRGLRFVLVNELMKRPSMTVAEMVTTMARYGYDLGGRASKVISDALRWERRRGRVARLARGVYAYHRAPATTARRIKRFAETCHGWIVAFTRHETPPPTPPDPRQPPDLSDFDDLHAPTTTTAPPWARLGWLWST